MRRFIGCWLAACVVPLLSACALFSEPEQPRRCSRTYAIAVQAGQEDTWCLKKESDGKPVSIIVGNPAGSWAPTVVRAIAE